MSYPERLYRYTKLEHALEMLEEKTICLTNPLTWLDQCDVKQLEAYRKYVSMPAVRVLCLSEIENSLLHWNIKKQEKLKDEICCVKFWFPALATSLFKREHLQIKKVLYYKASEIADKNKTSNIKPEKYPFIKRYPYRTEAEWRIVWAGTLPAGEKFKQIKILDEAIAGITLSPNIKGEDYKCYREKLMSYGLKPKQIHSSTLDKNLKWLRSLGIE